MAEVAFRPVRQLSEYKGKGASASREHFLWRVSTKIMQQSERQGLNKSSTRKGDIFWLYHTKLTMVYLYSLWLYLCSLEQLQTFRHKSDAM